MLLVACGTSSHRPRDSGTAADPGATAEPITFGTTTCAPNWRPLRPGRQRFRISNDSSRSATVYLFDSASGRLLATVHDLASHTKRELATTLAAGVAYSWGCDLQGYPEHVSDTERTPRALQAGGRPVAPVYIATLTPALDGYRTYVRHLLGRLQRQAGELLASSRSRNMARARTAWLSAHLTWLEIGQDDGAYGAFGELGQRIDGTAAGLVGGSRSGSFTGFHRIEYDLWRRRSLTRAAADTVELRRLIRTLAGRKLNSQLPASGAGMTNFTIRVHEVLEDALRDSLSADDDYGSDTDLASLAADVTATRKLLALLAPDLDPRAPALVATAGGELNTVSRAIDAARSGSDGRSMAALPERERQQIDADTGAAVETLARVPDLLRLGGS